MSVEFHLLCSVVFLCLRFSCTAASCASSALVKVANYSYGPQYGGTYELYLFTYTIDLEDCTHCIGSKQLALAKDYKTNTTWRIESLANITAGEDFELHQAVRRRMMTRTDMPPWFAARVRDFFDAFIGPASTLNCYWINESTGLQVVSDENSRLVDLKTLRVIPWTEACPLMAQRTAHIPAFCFYYAFFGYNGLGYAFQDANSGVFASEAADRAQRALMLLCAYCTPLTVSFLLFALYVVRKSLDTTDSHVYHYHKSLARADILIALLVFLKESQLIPFLIVPFCYASPTSWKSQIDTPQVFLGQSAIRQLWFVFPIVSVVCFTGIVQAILAMDRFVALFCPMAYLRISNVKTVRWLTLAAIVLTLISAAADLSTDTEFRCIVNAQFAGCRLLGGYASGVLSDGKLVRAAILAVACLIQVVCCSCIFIKMLLRLRNNSQHNISASRKLVSFYLLLGTCGLGLFGMCCEALYYIFDYNSSVSTGLRPMSAKFLSNEQMRWLSVFLARFRISIVSMCSSGGLILHLLVSSHCRAAAKYGLLVGSAKLRNVVSMVLAVKLSQGIRKLSNRSSAVTPSSESLALKVASGGGCEANDSGNKMDIAPA